MNLRVWTVDQSLMQSFTGGKGAPSHEKLEPIHLMYASDDASIQGVEASIRSVMQHTSDPVVFHYVGNTPLPNLPHVNVKYYNLNKVAKKYKLKEFTNLRERSENGYQGINNNLANYARFAMDSLLKKSSKAMWIDVDTIFKCDVSIMFLNTLVDKDSANIIAAVPSERSPRGFYKGVKKAYNMTIGFNAGVYVVDLKKWRSQNTTEKIRNIALKNRKTPLYSLGSQGPLVLATGDNFEPLSWKWNAKVSNFEREDREANEEDACLLHWSGPNKPWLEDGFRKDLWQPYAGNGAHSS